MRVCPTRNVDFRTSAITTGGEFHHRHTRFQMSSIKYDPWDAEVQHANHHALHAVGLGKIMAGFMKQEWQLTRELALNIQLN